MKCSSGTYVRKICEEIAEKLLTIGTMCELNREKVGEFDIKDSVTLDILENLSIEEIQKKYIPIPVSSTAIFANGILCLFAAKAAALKISSTFSCENVANSLCAALTKCMIV